MQETWNRPKARCSMHSLFVTYVTLGHAVCKELVPPRRVTWVRENLAWVVVNGKGKAGKREIAKWREKAKRREGMACVRQNDVMVKQFGWIWLMERAKHAKIGFRGRAPESGGLLQ
eukprot:scaffold2080_cov121-Skeletonema_menzelii.AAC.9